MKSVEAIFALNSLFLGVFNYILLVTLSIVFVVCLVFLVFLTF